MKDVKISLVLNIIIVILVTLGSIFMISGFNFMAEEIPLIATKVEALKYYTVDSNILMGVISFIFIIYEILLLKNKIKEIPRFVYFLKLLATAGVTLTFLITAIFLAPFSTYSFFAFYQNSNLFFHFIIPILSIISFIFFESTNKIKFKDTILAILSMIIYAVFYIINALTHVENGKVSLDYDWYGFLRNGVNSIIYVIPVMLLITYAISLTLWESNKKLYERRTKDV